MTLNIVIRPGSPVSIYRQIVEQVCAAVFAGHIDEDEPLPSVRALAEHLTINPNTVARAYSELSREGVLESRPGRGMFITKRRQIYSRAERNRRIEENITSLVAEAFMLGFTAEEIIEEVADRAKKFDPESRDQAKAKSDKPSTLRD